MELRITSYKLQVEVIGLNSEMDLWPDAERVEVRVKSVEMLEEMQPK